MTSCTIIISHYESPEFLRTCIRQIRRYRHELIDQIIYVADQSADETNRKIVQEFGNDEDIEIVRMKSLYSGYGVDYILRYCDIKTDYVAQMHVDCLVINPNWLNLCIKLIEEENFVFVGQHQFTSQPTDTIYYLNKMFFSMAAAFNIARTEHYKELSLNGGFTRFHNRPEDETGMTWANDDWANWAAGDYPHRGTDDDVVAFCWEDNHREHSKIGFAITGWIHPHYGRVIEDIIFHFCSCRESKDGTIFGDEYENLYKRIKENYDDDLVDEMLSMVKPTSIIRREIWDGITKEASASSEELNNKIERLKNGVE